ncbi:MAG: choice-of-anchor D domain-containing protein [Bacteroidota bacterium]
MLKHYIKWFEKPRLKSWAFLSLIFLLSTQLEAQDRAKPLGGAEWAELHEDICFSSGEDANVRMGLSPFWKSIAAQGGKMTLAQEAEFMTMKTATINIDFGDGFDALGEDAQAARDAFRFAADIWETEVVSVVPILIAADFANLGGNTLGQNGSPSLINVPNAPDPTTNYTLALANAIAGFDLSPGTPNGNQTYNTEFSFYFGIDGNTPAGQTDFATVVLHEIGHSMGISGISNGGNGVGANSGENPRSWDLLVELGDGTPILDLGFGTQEQQDALVGGDLFINGPLAVAALGGQRPEIFAPNPFNGGSSFSHWDEATFPAGDPNSLMTPFVGTAESNFDIGDITRGVLADQGWELSSDLEGQDVGIIAIVAPASDSDLGAAEAVTVSIRNFGIEAATGFEVSYTIDGGTPVTEVFNDTLPAVTIVDYTFGTTADLSSDNTSFSFVASTSLSGDEDSSNDSFSSIISNLVPTVELSANVLDFGALGLGDVSTLPLSVSSLDVEDLSGEVDILDIVIDTESSDAFSSNDLEDLPIEVLAGNSFDLQFTFSPSVEGFDSTGVVIVTNAGELNVVLFGTGIAPAVIDVTPGSLLSELAIGETETQSLTITNNGEATLDFDLAFSSSVDTGSDELSVAAPFNGKASAFRSSATSSLRSGPAVIANSFKSSTGVLNSTVAENSVYIIDDGSGENSIGLDSDNELMWLNAFTTVAGAEVITSISSAVASGLEETPARFILYEDPNDDGNPNDAVFLTEASGVLTNPGEDVFSTVNINPTAVEGVFFVAVLIIEEGGVNSFPMPQDNSSPSNRSSWVISNNVIGEFDVDSLPNNSIPPLLIDEAQADGSLAGNWLLRADGQFFSASPLSGSLAQGESTTIDVSFFASAPGLRESSILISNNDPSNSLVTVPVTLDVEGIVVNIDPEELVESLAQGQTSNQTLTLSNPGSDDITYNIVVEDDGLQEPLPDSIIALRGFNPVELRSEPFAGRSLGLSSTKSIRLENGTTSDLGTVAYGTDFEDFLLGDVNGQDAWFAQFGNWTAETVNPAGGSIHFRGLADGLGESAAVTPGVGIGSDPISSIRMDVQVVGTGVTWQLIPQSPTAESVLTRIQFAPDGSIEVLTGEGVFEQVSATVPEGYFNLRVDAVRATGEYTMYFDNEIVFEGAGFAGDIEEVVVLSLMEVAGPTLDLDNVQLIDGSSDGEADLFATPSPLAGVIPAGGSVDIDVLFDGNRAFGTYESNFVIGLNDNPGIPALEVPVTLNVTGDAGIIVDPTVILAEVDFQTTQTRIVTIENTGGQPVQYELDVVGAAVNELETGLDMNFERKKILDSRIRAKAENDLNQISSISNETPLMVVVGDVLLEEDFNGGTFPPAGWDVIDNEGTGLAWSFSADAGEENYTSFGEAATASSDAFGAAEFDTELRTPNIDITGKSGLFVQYTANYQNFAALDFLDFDVSTDGGATWTTALSWNEDHGGFFSLPGEDVTIDLNPLVAGASTMMLRWRYYDPNTGDFDWYAQIDDVVIFEEGAVWLTADRSGGVIPVGATAEVELIFDATPLEAGDFLVAGVIVNTDIDDAAEIGIVAGIEVRDPAVASVSPDSLSETLVEGEASVQNLTIQNQGESDLIFNFEEIFFNVPETEGLEINPDFISTNAPLSGSISQGDINTSAILTYSSATYDAISVAQYATDFEAFALGDISGQAGWFGQFGTWTVSDSNPFGTEQHYRGTSDGANVSLAFSPGVGIGTEEKSTLSMQMELQGTGVTWDIIPQSPSAGSVNTILRINPDGSIVTLISDGAGGAAFVPVANAAPEGYFRLTIELDRDSSDMVISFDDVVVFEGPGITGNIEQLVFRSFSEVAGPTLDVDNLQIIDGELFNSFVTVSPSSGVLTKTQSLDVDVNFDASNLLPGLYTQDLVLFTNDPNLPELTIPASLTVLSAPDITVSPDSIIEELTEGEVVTRSITVENSGEADLTFEIVIDSVSSQFLSISDTSGVVTGESSSTVDLTLDATTLEPGQYFAEVIFNSNDPDQPSESVFVQLTVDEFVILPLQLTSLCSNNPNRTREWRVRNPNEFEVPYTFEVVGTDQEGSGIASVGDSFFTTIAVEGPNTTIIRWFDADSVEQMTTKASGGAICDIDNGCTGDEVVAFNQGTKRNGGEISEVRSNPENTLGTPQENNTFNFVSLGFGGSIDIRLDNVIFDQPGDDFIVVETSFGAADLQCEAYPERADVYVSQDGEEYIFVGNTCLDGRFDIEASGLFEIEFVRIVDSSIPEDFGGQADGFDVDGIICIDGFNETENILPEIFNTVANEEGTTIGLNTYPVPARDFINIDVIADEALGEYVITIFDLQTGSLVFRETRSTNSEVTTEQLDLSQLSSGLYNIVIESTEKGLESVNRRIYIE